GVIPLAQVLAQDVGRHNFVPIVKSVPPKARVPALVDLIERAVAPLEPPAEGPGAVVTIAIAAVLVGDVPGYQGGMIFVPLGKTPGQLGRIMTVCGTVGARVVPHAVLALSPMKVDPQHVGVRSEERRVGKG